jgi:tRNA(fMet)-specific endonuclease VapC
LSQYLLDTNVCVEYLRRRNSRVMQRFQSLDPSDLFLCPIVLGELYYGAYRSADPLRNLQLLSKLVSLVECAPYDTPAAAIYGQLRAHLVGMGTPIGPHDVQIAAIALSQSMILVTHNVAEFSRVPGISVEDWQT